MKRLNLALHPEIVLPVESGDQYVVPLRNM